MDDLRYYDIMNPKGRKTAKKTPDRDSLGIGTRSCFAFRPPRTITTADMSVEDIDTNSHPSDEKLGLLQSLEPAAITRSWTYSSADTTANLTSMQSSQISSPANTISTAERGGYSSSGGDSSLLSMPTPTDRSHRRRLKMERGGQVHKYDGEQEPAGYRGQEAALNAPVTPSPRAQPNNLLAMPASKDRSRRRREGNINRYQGELDPTGNWEQESPPTTPMAPAPQGSLKLLAMPTPTDRSQVRRLQHERNGKGSAYEGEQEPTGFRGQEAVTPVNATYRGGENRNLLALPTSTDRSHRKRAEQERRGRSNAYAGKQQPMGHESRISSDNLPEPIFRTPIASGRLRRDPSGLIGAPKHPNESFLGDDSPTKGTGSPYLQFSTDGPALRVFETSPKRLISPNSSMMDTSVESSDQIRWMVKDLVPLSASAEKKIKNRVAAYQPTQGDLQIAPAPPKRKLKPILKAPSVRSDYSVANTHDTSIWSGVVDGQSSLGPLTVTVSPERSAFAVIRGSPSGGEVSVSSASTRSSVTLRDMMNDLVEDSATAASGRSGPITDIDEMAASAQSHVEQGEYDLALVLFGRILALQRRQYGNVHPLVASAYHNLGIVHSQRGSLLLEGTLQQKHVRQQSLQCFQAAARTARDSLGRNHPNVAVSLVKIGFLLLQARQYEPALVTFEEALRIRLVAFGGNPNQLTANLYNNLGICLLHLQRFDESKLNLNKALGIQRHMLRVERLACTRDDLQVRLLEVADTLANLGGLGLEWLRQEGPQQEIMWEAESQLAEALEIRSTVLGYHHPLALQVKSLHDMVQSTPSLVGERNLPPSNAKLQTSSSARSLTRGLPKEAIHPSNQGYQSSPPTMSRGLPVSRVLSLTYSPERSLNTSSDAPAPKAYSPSPVIELLAQHLKADARDESTSVSPRMRISVDSTSLSRSRAIPLVPPVSEVVVEEEEDGGQGSNRIPERTKIFVSPHYVPRKSPTRKFSSKDESNYSDLKTPPLVSSSGFECSDRRQSQSRAYDTEESCLLNQSGDRIDLLSRFLVNSDEDNEDGLNLSSHEIMIVRPSSTSGMSPDVPGPLAQPLPRTINGQWKGDINRNTQQQQPSVRGKEQLDESDDGIAPLSRSEKTKRDQKMHLSEDMLENPEPHIVDIYAAASRYLKKNRLLEAKHLFLTVLDCQRKAHGELHEDVGSALHNVGLVHLRANEYGEALTFFERAVRVRKGSLGREHPEVAVSQVKVGITLLLMHSFDSALQAFVEALSIRKRALGDLHASNAAIYCNIGCVHVEFNELRDARRAFEAALDIQRNALYHEPDSGPLMFGTATTLCNLGYLYRYREMHQKVAMVLTEALSLQEGVLGQTHPTVVTTMDSLADALSMSGGCSQALRYYCEILSRLEHVVDVSTRRQAEAAILYKCSRVHRKQNDAEAEVDKLKKALQAVRGTGVKNPTEKKRKEQLERHILADIQRSREELEKMQLEWI